MLLLARCCAYGSEVNSELQERSYTVNLCWWDNFSDPYLKNYIVTAIEKNHELKRQNYITKQYGQSIKTTRAREFPSLAFAPAFARIGNLFISSIIILIFVLKTLRHKL